MAYSLPLNEDGSLAAFTDDQIAAMDIQLRGPTLEEHVEYNFGPDGSGCTRKFSCAWAEQFNTLLYFVGACVQYNPSSGTPEVAISRMLPMADPDYAGWYCTKVTFEPFGFTGETDDPVTGSQSYPEYTRANFTAVFELVPYYVMSDSSAHNAALGELTRYVTYPGYPGAEVTADSQYIGLPGGTFGYSTTDGTSRPAGVSIPYPVGFVEGSEKFKVIWRRVPFASWGVSSSLSTIAPLTEYVLGTATERGVIGSVNLTSFLGYPPLSLQLLGVEQRLLPDPNGLTYSWDLGYLMSHKPVPFGQLGFYFHDIANPAMGVPGTASGYYQVQRGSAGYTTLSAADLAKNDTGSLFIVREFANLFNVASS